MTDEEIGRILDTARTEEEMLDMARKFDVCERYFNIGSCVDLNERETREAERGKFGRELELQMARENESDHCRKERERPGT